MKILLIEDERDLANALTRALADEGVSCTAALKALVRPSFCE